MSDTTNLPQTVITTDPATGREFIDCPTDEHMVCVGHEPFYGLIYDAVTHERLREATMEEARIWLALDAITGPDRTATFAAWIGPMDTGEYRTAYVRRANTAGHLSTALLNSTHSTSYEVETISCTFKS